MATKDEHVAPWLSPPLSLLLYSTELAPVFFGVAFINIDGKLHCFFCIGAAPIVFLKFPGLPCASQMLL